MMTWRPYLKRTGYFNAYLQYCSFTGEKGKEPQEAQEAQEK
jgi:hypothetical protein